MQSHERFRPVVAVASPHRRMVAGPAYVAVGVVTVVTGLLVAGRCNGGEEDQRKRGDQWPRECLIRNAQRREGGANGKWMGGGKPGGGYRRATGGRGSVFTEPSAAVHSLRPGLLFMPQMRHSRRPPRKPSGLSRPGHPFILSCDLQQLPAQRHDGGLFSGAPDQLCTGSALSGGQKMRLEAVHQRSLP